MYRSVCLDVGGWVMFVREMWVFVYAWVCLGVYYVCVGVFVDRCVVREMCLWVCAWVKRVQFCLLILPMGLVCILGNPTLA